MKYGLFKNGRMIRLVDSLKKILESRVYEPWLGGCEIYEFRYDPVTLLPIGAKKI
jgi:hypothetical protein